MPSAKTKAAIAVDAGPGRQSIWFIAGLVLAISVGVFLRLYLLRDQILLDDEWHGMNYAALSNSFSGVLTHFSLGLATSIPLNVYNYILLKTIGWNETWIRLPSIVAGLLSLFIFPLLVRQTFNRRVTLIFTALLTISPFLIFYSRMARPYSLVVLFGFAAIWALYLWATRGGKKYAAIYVSCACVTICLHLFTVVAMMVPLGIIALIALRDCLAKVSRKNRIFRPTLGPLTISAVLIAGVSAAFLKVGLTSSTASLIIGQDHMTLATLTGFASLLSGTANPVFISFFVVLLALGLLFTAKERWLLPSIFVLSLIFYFIAFAIVRPSLIHDSIVVTRYVTVLFPLGLLLVAVGIDTVASYFESIVPGGRSPAVRGILNGVCCFFIAGLGVAGPLPQIYSPPNNFTNHSVFENSYERRVWDESHVVPGPFDQSLSVRKEDIPDFYWKIAHEPNATIIEFPMSFVNAFNLYYYYQHFHRNRVLIGYLPEINLSKVSYFIWVDPALSAVRPPRKFYFRNMVNLDDIESIRSSGAKYVILHTDLLGGEWKKNFDYPRQNYSALTGYLRENFIQAFGSPIFSDEHIIVFQIQTM